MLSEAHAARFEPERARLRGLAYRMLGSLAEAEDVVQDAFLRFAAAALDQIEEPGAYLYKTVARLCLDRLKAARTRRESYVGTWLPEPIVDEPAPDAALSLADDLSFALLLTLERLSPPERTAFLLHDVFGLDFAAIGQVLERTAAGCRKLAERARDQVHAGRTRVRAQPAAEQQLLAAFLKASGSGDVAELTQLLARDAILYTDGGGKRLAALNPVEGRDRIVRFLSGIRRKPQYQVPRNVMLHPVNQLPGCVVHYDDGSVAVAAIEVEAGRISRVYVISNPDKLRHVGNAC